MDFLPENASIGSLVAKTPEYASYFEKLGIDYCCKGNKTLQEVCNEKNLNIADVLQKLKQTPDTGSALDWDQMSLKQIVEYIIATYHIYTRQELTRISQLLKKVSIKHGHRYAYIAQLQNIFEKVKDDLLEHMDEEEKDVFPLIMKFAMDESSSKDEVKKCLSSLDEDHLETGADLEKMKELTNDYTPPSDACMTHIVMLHSLKRLEQNLHDHIHKENHVLFPRVAKQL